MLTEKHHDGGFLMTEGDGHYSRENVTLDATATTTTEVMEAGTVLGKITATGNYAKYDQQAGDGTQTAVAILFGQAAATGADQKVCIIARLAEVNSDELVWPGGSPTDVAAGVVDLAAVGIIAR